MKKKVIGISIAVLGFGAVAALNFGIAVERNNLGGPLLLNNIEALASELMKAVPCYKAVELLDEKGQKEVIICPTNHVRPILDDCPKKQMAYSVTTDEEKPANKGECMTVVVK